MITRMRSAVGSRLPGISLERFGRVRGSERSFFAGQDDARMEYPADWGN